MGKNTARYGDSEGITWLTIPQPNPESEDAEQQWYVSNEHRLTTSFGCDWQKPANNFVHSASESPFRARGRRLWRCKSPPDRDLADATLGQWNLTLSRTVSALSGYSQGSDSVRDRQGPSAPLSGPGWRSPSRRSCPPRPLWLRRPGLLLRLPRCSSTACTAVSERGWGRGLPATVTRGTRRCWRRRWRLWSAASLNTRRVTAEVRSSGDKCTVSLMWTQCVDLCHTVREFEEQKAAFSCAICLEVD